MDRKKRITKFAEAVRTKLLSYAGKEINLRKRLFNFSCIAGLVGAFFAFVAAVISGLPPLGTGSSFLCFVAMVVLCIFCFNRADRISSRILISVALNFMLFPILFFTSGGIKSGMPFYFLLGIYVAFIILDGALRYILPGSMVIVYTLILWAGYCHPEWAVSIEGTVSLSDVISSFVIVTVCITATTWITVSEYEKGNKRVMQWNQLLEEQSRKDALTGLYNRRYFTETLTDWIEREKKNSRLALIFLDIDDFKQINDTYGHLAGDRALIKVADILQGEVKDSDFAVRFGGEELLITAFDRSPGEAERLAERIRERIFASVRMEKQGETRNVSVSGGIGYYKEGMDLEELLLEADRKLYQAKAEGKNRIRA